MTSVFEYLGMKKQPEFTSVPQLRISNPLYSLQLKSQRYFSILEGAQAANANMLAVSIEEKQDFNLDNPDHIACLKECVLQFKKSSAELKSLDMQITTSVITAVVATSLSYIPFASLIGFIAWGAALYFMNQRANAYTEYKDSLTLLVATCNWSLGQNLTDRKNNPGELTTHSSVRSMMSVLYPVLTESQVRHLIADDIEEIFVAELSEYERQYQEGFNPNRFFNNVDDRIALGKKRSEFNRCIYGFNKGGLVDFLDALASALPDLYRAAYRGWQHLNYWWQERNHVSPQEEENKHKVMQT